MTGSPTTQGTSATELTERDGSPARSGHQFDGLANASNRAPRLVATKVENISVEPSGKAPLPATKRSRPRPAPKRTKATKATKAKGKQEAPSAPLTVSAAPTVPEAVPATPERASRAFALVAALALATVAAYFSVTGMAEIFPGLRLPSWCSPPRWRPANSL